MPLHLKRKKTEFEVLKEKWYKKLKKSGFNDIEQDEDNLKAWSSKFATQKVKDLYESKQAYYYMATQFINDYVFSSKIDQIIWEYHAEGISMRDIAKTLNKTRTITTNKDAVNIIIRKLEKIMYFMYRNGSIDEF